MSNPEFDITKPKLGMCGYRLQLSDGSWTEWRDISVKLTENYVLSMQLTEYVTKEQAEEFFKQFTIGG